MTTGVAEAASTYETLRAFAASWGLIFFGVIFLGVVAFAFWPSRRETFEQDAQIPFREDDDDVSGHV